MTNWEKYFGTPEKAAQVLVYPWSSEAEMYNGVIVEKDGEIVAYLCEQEWKTYLEWLQEECDTEEEASLNE